MAPRKTSIFAIAVFAAATGFQPVRAQQPSLPETVAAPEVHPAPAGNILPQRPGDTPVPEARPDEAPAIVGGAGDGPATPPTAPIPTNPPTGDAPGEAQGKAAGQSPVAAPPLQHDPRSDAAMSLLMPPAEIVCRRHLREAGVVFEDRPAERDEAGCALPYPLAVTQLPGGIGVEPEAVVNCTLAEAMARFATGTLAPVAQESFGSRPAAIEQASAYVCRPRNGTTKLSEHAFGNALDIAGFRLADGRSIAVSPSPDAATGAFLSAVRAAACGPFKTVLGPGSNADHELHLHLDLAPRHSSTAICE